MEMGSKGEIGRGGNKGLNGAHGVGIRCLDGKMMRLLNETEEKCEMFFEVLEIQNLGHYTCSGCSEKESKVRRLSYNRIDEIGVLSNFVYKFKHNLD